MIEARTIEARLSRVIPLMSVVVALLTGGAWLAAGPETGPPGWMPPGQQQPPMQPPMQPPPPEPRPVPPARSGCADCCSGCDCSGCDVGDCDVSGCDLSDCDLSGCDLSGCDCTFSAPNLTLHALGFLVFLLPLALLDAWRRRIVREERAPA